MKQSKEWPYLHYVHGVWEVLCFVLQGFQVKRHPELLFLCVLYLALNPEGKDYGVISSIRDTVYE